MAERMAHPHQERERLSVTDLRAWSPGGPGAALDWAEHEGVVKPFNRVARLRVFRSPNGEFAEALNELDELPRAEHVGYGDRFGANGATEQAILRARRFLVLMPKFLPAPEVSALPEGEVALQWLGARDIRLTVAIGEESKIAYAGMFKDNKASGRERFDGRRIPEVVLDQIERFAGMMDE